MDGVSKAVKPELREVGRGSWRVQVGEREVVCGGSLDATG